MSTHLTEDQWRQIDVQLRAGNRVEAVKLIRQFTGAGLEEARNFLDAHDADGREGLPTGMTRIGEIEMPEGDSVTDAEAAHKRGATLDEQQWRDVDACLEKGDKIGAIKLHRQLSGLGLKESKAAIDERHAKLHGQFPERYPAPGGGCLSAVGILVLIGMGGAAGLTIFTL